MSETQLGTEPSGNFDFEETEIFEKKETNLLNTDKFSIKKFNNGVFEDAYDGVFDLSNEDSKKEFGFLTKVINANNWYCIPVNVMAKFNDEECSLEDLEKLTKKTHENLTLNFHEFPKKEVKNNFIDDAEGFKSVQDESAINTTIPEKTIIKLEPRDVVTNLDLTVKSKLNYLHLRREQVKKSNGISLKSIAACAGVWAVGAVLSPLSAITVPVAIGIGIWAVGKAFLLKNPETKNYDKQINLLQKATTNYLYGENDSRKITDSTFKEILFNEKIESEFAKLCAKNNVHIDKNIFPNGYKYKDAEIIEHNREVRKNRLLR